MAPLKKPNSPLAPEVRTDIADGRTGGSSPSRPREVVAAGSGIVEARSSTSGSPSADGAVLTVLTDVLFAALGIASWPPELAFDLIIFLSPEMSPPASRAGGRLKDSLLHIPLSAAQTTFVLVVGEEPIGPLLSIEKQLSLIEAS